MYFFILVFISSYFRSVWHPFSCFILRMVYFALFLCYLSWAYTFYIMFIPHCKYFFLSSCTRNMAHNAVNTRSQSLLHRTCTCTRPVRQMPFGVTILKIANSSETDARPHISLPGHIKSCGDLNSFKTCMKTWQDIPCKCSMCKWLFYIVWVLSIFY